MKRIFVILISIVCLSICHEANAQNNVYLAPDPQTARWSYIETDSKGKHISTIHNSIESIEGDAVNGRVKLRIEEIPVGSPKEATTSFSFYRFMDGELMVDMIAGIEENLFEGKSLDSLVNSTIKEKYPDLQEEKKKEVVEKIKSDYLNITGQTRGIPRYPKLLCHGRDHNHKGHDDERCRENQILVRVWYRSGKRNHLRQEREIDLDNDSK